MATDIELKEFLEEINLMKSIGYHKNIVNFVGCSTVKKPFYLVLEYMPYGDLLHYLRTRRTKVGVWLCLVIFWKQFQSTRLLNGGQFYNVSACLKGLITDSSV